MEQTFQLFGNLHLSALAASALVVVLMVWYAKKKVHTAQQRRRDILIFMLVFALIYFTLTMSKVLAQQWSIQWNLPLHLCDLSAWTIIYALYKKHEGAFRLGYFWGLVGGFMAIATPNLQTIDWYFVPFFIWHIFLIAAPLYQMIVDKMEVTHKSIYTTLGITIIIALPMMVLNHFLKSNYMFLNEKISSFDALGLPDYPYYLAALLLLALALFYLVWGLSKLIQKNRYKK